MARLDRGSMTVETAFLVILVVAPLIYLVGTLGQLQAGAYAVTAAAREAGRTFVTAPDPTEAATRAQTAAGLVFTAHGFEDAQGSVSLGCPTGPCLEPGGSVVVDAQISVPLPLVPDFMRDVLPAHITMTAQHVEPVDEFREAG